MTETFFFFIGAVVGYLFWHVASQEEDCPRERAHYRCMGNKCDHRKSILYRMMADEAEMKEKSKNARG